MPPLQAADFEAFTGVRERMREAARRIVVRARTGPCRHALLTAVMFRC